MKKNRWFAVIPAMVMVLAIPGFSEGSDSKKMQGNKLANLALAESSKGSYSDCVVGDFVLKDGTVLSKDETPEIGTVAAVIVRAAADGKPALGVGIVHSRGGLAWCTDYGFAGFTGYDIKITALVGDKTTGYMDGSDGWEKLKAACPDAESNPEEYPKYPAWNYCRNYGANNGLTGDLATGWYLPTVAELYTIYQNIAAVDKSLSKAGGSQFDNEIYWSCCQSPSYNNFARVLAFSYGNMFDFPKTDNGDANATGDYRYYYLIYVCSVRAFN